MQTISSYLVKISVNVVNYCTIKTWYKIVIDICFCNEQNPREISQKVQMTEVLFLHSARRLMLVDTCIKFRKYCLSSFQVIERIQFL